MSRKPTPEGFKVISGTARPDRKHEDAPHFAPVDAHPEAPQHLNPDGAGMWKKLGEQLVAVKVLQTPDLFALETLCYAWQQFRKKAKAEMEVPAAELTALKALFSEFGITPAARHKVGAGVDAPKGNKFTGIGKKPLAPGA